MQDRFKFRIWYGPEKKMMLFNNPALIDGKVNSKDNGGLLFRNYDHNIKDVHECNPKDFKLMQCTGLKDKNGKLIYEGDIVNLKNTRLNFEQTHVVMFKNCAFQFSLPNSMQIDRPLYCWAINYLNHYKHIDLEVLGNIYENPELLTEEVQA